MVVEGEVCCVEEDVEGLEEEAEVEVVGVK